MQRWGRKPDTVPDTVALIIWLIAGVAGGNAIGELLKGHYDLGLGNTVAGAIGGVIGAQILQMLIPSLGRFDFVPILGQAMVAAACGAALTIVAAIVKFRRRRRY
jgi:uncharacterized membrane protein YeaQ/YmgE (transglycosylase-associated protein family)